MLDDNEAIWKALSDPSRRTVLHLLRNGRKTTGEIAKHFDQTRFAIMKHLSSLEVGCRLQVTHQAVGTIDQFPTVRKGADARMDRT